MGAGGRHDGELEQVLWCCGAVGMCNVCNVAVGDVLVDALQS